MKIGIVGCGAIGKTICRAFDQGIINAHLTALSDRDPVSAQELADSLVNIRPRVMDTSALIDAVDLVVECAAQSAVPDIVIPALEKGRDVMIMSIGALTDERLWRRIKSLASEHDCRVYLPSGAIVGLDGLKSASMAKMSSVMLITRKHPSGFQGAPYIEQHKIDLNALKKATIIFEGCAEDAVRAFPANVNVAATLSLAGIGTKNTRVRIIADPALSRNVHEIYVEGEFGKFETRVENVPSPDNPRTSYLAALSTIATLKKIVDEIQIGT
ncbi:MAG: aspartate dehydrogenase [Methanosarcinales archaeon Met12]|nr:MAG: aspartate dehydrogenase [Methanosarcinales archaeon Met12]